MEKHENDAPLRAYKMKVDGIPVVILAVARAGQANVARDPKSMERARRLPN